MTPTTRLVLRPALLPLLAFLLAGLTTPPGRAAAPPPGFTALFNGRDLTGWVPVNVAADTFGVRDGMIVTTGVPTGFLRTERVYENFVIELEWRHLRPGGNSGLFIWGEGLPAPGVPYARGIEVQILDPGYAQRHQGANEWFTVHGDIFPIWGATMEPTGRVAAKGRRSFPTEDRTKPSPEWNHYRVTCNRGEIRLEVNGREVTVGRECNPRQGYLCLESEGSETHFRNIQIKELPSANPPPELHARTYPGFKPLFDGKSFAGWKVTDELRSVWSVSGAHFKAAAGKKGSKLDLWTQQSYRNFELCADWRVAKNPKPRLLPTFTADGLFARDPEGKVIRREIPDAGDSGIYLRGAARYQVNIWSQPMGSGDINELHKDAKVPAEIRRALLPRKKADAPFGQWNRFFITLVDDRVTVVLNGETVIESAQLPGIAAEGPLALQYHHDEIEFANLFIRELP